MAEIHQSIFVFNRFVFYFSLQLSITSHLFIGLFVCSFGLFGRFLIYQMYIHSNIQWMQNPSDGVTRSVWCCVLFYLFRFISFCFFSSSLFHFDWLNGANELIEWLGVIAMASTICIKATLRWQTNQNWTVAAISKHSRGCSPI